MPCFPVWLISIRVGIRLLKGHFLKNKIMNKIYFNISNDLQPKEIEIGEDVTVKELIDWLIEKDDLNEHSEYSFTY